MCHSDGGFSGNGDGMCPDFFGDRHNERIIWWDLKRSGRTADQWTNGPRS
jgi:uncharacterized protein DUF6970